MHLSESMRQQYLKSMGIQTWFDPALIDAQVSECVEQDVEPNSQAPSGIDDAVLEKNIPTPVSQKLDTPTKAPSTIIDENIAVESLESLSLKITQCELCELHINRQQAIFGEGSIDAKIFIIIDAPINESAGDNALFSAADKQMLQAMLQAIGCQLSSVFISSLVKCQPPKHRAPQTSEMICCDDHLSAQIKLIKPDVILIMGEQASQQLLVSQKLLSDLRLRHHKHLGVPVYASYHPRDLFASSETKRKVWADLLQIKQHLTI